MSGSCYYLFLTYFLGGFHAYFRMDIDKFNDLVNSKCESLPKPIQTEPLPFENVVMGIFDAITTFLELEKSEESFEGLMFNNNRGPRDFFKFSNICFFRMSKLGQNFSEA